jgi:uncharacterized hydrophobic protein (TIGR00271 family)
VNTRISLSPVCPAPSLPVDGEEDQTLAGENSVGVTHSRRYAVLQLRVIVPGETTEEVCGLLDEGTGVSNVIVLPAAGREPQGDLVLCDVARECASELLERLRGLGLDTRGSLALQNIDLLMSQAAERAERAAPGSPANAVVWEEVEQRTSEEASLSVSYLLLLVIAALIAGLGVLTDSPILIVGAMVVGPEFGPLAGLCVGIVQRRMRVAIRSLLALVVGFPVAIVFTALFTWVTSELGIVGPQMLESTRPLTSFIWHPDVRAFGVAFLAGVAGILSLTTAKSGALIGVLISVTTVPAAANAAVALAFGDYVQARGSFAQLGVNMAAIVCAGVFTLYAQKLTALTPALLHRKSA